MAIYTAEQIIQMFGSDANQWGIDPLPGGLLPQSSTVRLSESQIRPHKKPPRADKKEKCDAILTALVKLGTSSPNKQIAKLSGVSLRTVQRYRGEVETELARQLRQLRQLH